MSLEKQPCPPRFDSSFLAGVGRSAHFSYLNELIVLLSLASVLRNFKKKGEATKLLMTKY
jgi:hypothetical protein